MEAEELMATLASAFGQSSYLTEKEYVPLAPYSETSGAVLTQSTDVVIVWQDIGWAAKPIDVQARIVRQGLAPQPQVTRIPDWVKPTVQSLVRILRLPPNWDSYGAQRVQDVLVGRALEFLPRVMAENAPPPSVVPLNDGGLQLEWHLKGRDLEVAVTADEAPAYYYRELDGPPEEGLVYTALDRLRSIIQELS